MASCKTTPLSKTVQSVDNEGTGRFLDVDAVPQRMLMPIEGYENMPLVSLEEAVMPLSHCIPKIQNKVELAKKYSKRELSNLLPLEQHAAIKLYTMEWMPDRDSLYFRLNETLRNESREELKPWFLYLKLLLTALSQIPSISGNIFRGVKRDLRHEYPKDTDVVWWGFSSSTSNMDVLKEKKFLGPSGPRTLFIIECQSAKDIKPYSQFKRENEYLLPPARRFQVLGCLPQTDGLVMVHMKEIKSPHALINLLEPNNPSESNVVHGRKISSLNDADSQNWDRPMRGTQLSLDRSSQWLKQDNRITDFRRPGSDLNQLDQPCGLFVDDDDSIIFVADSKNHRIVKWSLNVNEGVVVAGGRGQGDADNQLDTPTDVIIDRRTNRLLICDTGNRRIVSWSLRGEDEEGRVVISDISCEGLTMDAQGFVYISDSEKYEVRRLDLYEPKKRILVAGGHGCGNNLDQLSFPTCLFVDKEGSLFVSDSGNHRVMKWSKNAIKGEIVAGGHGAGADVNQLHYPSGITVDGMGTVYVADKNNNRIMVWSGDSREGFIFMSGNDRRSTADQLSAPHGLSFDRHGNLYVTEWKCGRIKKYSLLNT